MFWLFLYCIFDLLFDFIILAPLRLWKLFDSRPLDSTVYSDKNESYDAILLLHGSGMNEMPFTITRSILNNIMQKNNKYYRIYSCDLSKGYFYDTSEGIDVYASRVKTYIETVIYKKRTDKLILVGHSMGGLVAGCVAMNDPKIDIVVSLGTPWFGAPILELLTWVPIWWGKRHDQMRISSKFLPDLRDAIGRIDHTKYITAGTKTDLIVPIGRYFLNHTNVEKIEINTYGHTLLLISPHTWDVILTKLGSY